MVKHYTFRLVSIQALEDYMMRLALLDHKFEVVPIGDGTFDVKIGTDAPHPLKREQVR